MHLRLFLLACCYLVHNGNGNADVYTRYDRDAYLAAGGIDNDGGELKDRIRNINDGDGNQRSYDDPNKCTTYLAQSSIPNSGLGMYTTAPYRKGDAFPFPEIGIILQEKNHHYSFSSEKSHDEKLLNQYPWAASVVTLGTHEVGYGETIVPGLGMLANSHLGLVNIRHSEQWKVQPWRDGTDALHRTESMTMEDAGRGAHSGHGKVRFEASATIEAGEELFVSYGDEWFAAREKLLGIVPGEDQFTEADGLLRSFSEEHEKWEEEHGADSTVRFARYQKLLREASDKDKRLGAALPSDINDVPTASSLGTARFSAKDSVRSIEWLEENGACIDNIVSGLSTVPQAGRGAFATRLIHEGAPVTTTPVVTLERDELLLWEKAKETEDRGAAAKLVGHQLLLNYCYGHANSSLLFFPYAPSVNFINHGGVEESNAVIRWSTLPYHKVEWLDLTLEEMKDKLKTGLLFDIVATRDILRGEEILLNYGKHWEESWVQHTEEWAWTEGEGADANDEQPHLNLTDRLGVPTTNELNQSERNPTIRTKDEQAEDPYPPHIMTRCHFKPPESCLSFTHIHPTHSTELHCRSRWELTFDALQLHPCTILARETIRGMDWYTAQVVETAKGESESTLHLVEYMTRDAIVFVDQPYSKDQYARGVFRHPIGLPNGIMPSQWLDLDGAEKG